MKAIKALACSACLSNVVAIKFSFWWTSEYYKLCNCTGRTKKIHVSLVNISSYNHTYPFSQCWILDAGRQMFRYLTFFIDD